MSEVIVLKGAIQVRAKKLHRKIAELHFLATEKRHEYLKLKDQLDDARKALARIKEVL